MPITENDLTGLRDGKVVTTSGDKIGSIGQIYLDDETGSPSFVTANTGLFGTSQSFVPLQGASVQDGDIVVDYDKDTVKNAPRIDDDGKLSPEEEDRLYDYYGLGGGTTQTTTTDYDRTDEAYATAGTTAGTTTDAGYDRGADYDAGADRSVDVDAGTVGDDTSGPTTDDAMTRSEERLNVGTQTAGGRSGPAAQVRRHRGRHPDRSGVARGGSGRA